LVLWVQREYPDDNYIFLQDLSPVHTPEPPRRETMADIWIPADWPPYLLDLNMLDFSLWSDLQEKVQVRPHASLAALHRSITRQ
jgi:hypothetical protein